MWCLYFKDWKIASDILECDGSILETGSTLTVTVTEDRSALERMMKTFSKAGKKLTVDVIEKLKVMRDNDELLAMAKLIEETTGEKPCCKGQIEQFMKGL